MNLFVGNLNFEATEDDLLALFGQFGEVTGARILINHKSHSRGFGFVEMPNAAEAESAIEALSGSAWMGRDLTVNEARAKQQYSRKETVTQ